MGNLMAGQCRSSRRLDGKVAVITGANTGIGKITAADLSRRGARVIMLCRSLERAEPAAADIRYLLSCISEIIAEHLKLMLSMYTNSEFRIFFN